MFSGIITEIKPFYFIGLFLYNLKTSVNHRIFDAFRGYRQLQTFCFCKELTKKIYFSVRPKKYTFVTSYMSKSRQNFLFLFIYLFTFEWRQKS